MSEPAVTRIVIACDPVGENRAGIASAARLAAALNAVLHGVFVEDEALLNWAAMPFARSFAAGGTAGSDVDAEALLHHFAAHAERVRNALETAAREHDVGWSFGIVRGPSTLATLGVEDRDLLVIEAASRPFAGTFQLDSRWLAAALMAHRPVLLVRNHATDGQDVIALVQGKPPQTEGVIATAAALAHAAQRKLTLLLAEGALDAEAARHVVDTVSERLAARTTITPIGTPRAPALETSVPPDALLVVDADPAINDAEILRDLTAKTRSDILFLR